MKGVSGGKGEGGVSVLTTTAITIHSTRGTTRVVRPLKTKICGTVRMSRILVMLRHSSIFVFNTDFRPFLHLFQHMYSIGIQRPLDVRCKRVLFPELFIPHTYRIAENLSNMMLYIYNSVLWALKSNSTLNLYTVPLHPCTHVRG